jgi:signal transduction histidine kinase/ligand-binding sensor domain-containing protein
MRGMRRLARGGVALGMLLVCPCALALNPALDISQYAHHAWRNSEGFAKGPINSIAQTADGYLWLGTDFGLLRFDGVRVVPWQAPADQPLPSNRITRLLVARDGTLWIGTLNGLASWKGGKLTRYAELADQTIGAILQDHEGAVWTTGIGLPAAKLCAIRDKTVRCYGEDGRFGVYVGALCEYRGDLWVGALTGLWQWKPDHPQRYPLPGVMPQIQHLMEGDDGALWISMSGQLGRLVNGKIEPHPLPAGQPIHLNKMLRDRDGGLWVGTRQGLVHLHQGRTDSFAKTDGLSGDYISSLFEDREGNIWAGTPDGIDCFRNLAITTISEKQGVRGAVVSVLAAGDGSVWLSTEGGLTRWHDGQVKIYHKRSAGLRYQDRRTEGREIVDAGLPDNTAGSLFQDARGRIWISTIRGVAYFEDGRFVTVDSVPTAVVAYFVEERQENLWIADQLLGLFHLIGEQLIDHFSWTKLGHQDPARAVAFDRAQGGLWLGFYRGGVAYFKDGQVRASYGAPEGLGAGNVNDFRLDSGGALWAATEGGLSRVKDGRIATLTSKNGLPCDEAYWSVLDDAQSMWLNMPCGLVSITRSDWNAWVSNPGQTIKAVVFDISDGVKNRSAPGGFHPYVSKALDGRLWFVTTDGVGVIDPRHLSPNRIPPPVQIEEVIADRKSHWKNLTGSGSNPRLPPLVRTLQIDYTALSFAAPEKVRFRYRLDGYDSEWTDAGPRRQAFYNDLAPRSYRFRVMACNNNGVWNEAGAALDFSIAPAYYQTTWFQVLCVIAACTLLWVFYRLRIRQMSAIYHARLAERTRIARDLHDTLLQSLAGVSLQLHGIAKTAAATPEKTPSQIERIRQQVDASFREARMKVHNLRSPAVEGKGLTEALSDFLERLGPTVTARCTLHVTGEPLACRPEIAEELLHIAQEAANNANRHAGAKEIQIAVEYSERSVKLSISDDGCGFHLEEGLAKTGHWGLKNMPERAAHIRGKCVITSALGQGTKIEVHVPLRRWSMRKTRENVK